MKNKQTKYFAELIFNGDNTVKVAKAKQLVRLNQHKQTWKEVNSRELARAVNTSNLVIK